MDEQSGLLMHRDGNRFVVRADEKLAAFRRTRIGDCDPTERPEDCRARASEPRQIAAMMLKAFSVTSSDVSTYLRHG
jgi:hypothetical protein